MSNKIMWEKIDDVTYRAYDDDYVDIGDAYFNMDDGKWIVTIPSIDFKEKGQCRYDVFELALIKYNKNYTKIKDHHADIF